MVKTWLISDTHFGHQGVCNFTRDDGSPLRPWDNADDMDAALVANWNAVVAPGDRVYHLGDVAIKRQSLVILERCNGRKALVKGNHDIFKLNDYRKYFDDVRAYIVLKSKTGAKVILSHIPIHPGTLGRFGTNLHGHLHANIVSLDDGSPDPRYINVCVEHTNYTPIALDTFL